MNPRIKLTKPGFTPIIVRRSWWCDCWEMLTYTDHYGGEKWQDIPLTIDVEEHIRIYGEQSDAE